MQTGLNGERIWFDGHTLGVSFRTNAPCFACALLDSDGKAAARAPALRIGSDHECRIDLTGVAAGEYRIVALTVPKPLEIRTSVAQKQPKRGGRHAVAAMRSSFRTGDQTTWALLCNHPTTGAFRLRLSAADDADAYLESLQPKTTPIRFSVVSACYNVARYLDDFFESIAAQTLDLKSHIELIMVDDGSTDDTAKVIKKWRKRYPDAIRCFRKENGGPASARNLGLSRASHEWITFIDPDDFVDRKYFSEVAGAVCRYGEERVAMVSCNVIRYLEATGEKRDDHPLRFRYKQGEMPLPTAELGNYVQLSAATAFFRRSLISSMRPWFDERVRPNFEDAHFVGRYLHGSGDKLAIFSPAARYLYRKRSNRSSLLDSTTTDPDWYGAVLKYGCLGLLHDTARDKLAPPRHLQNTILYHLSWQFRHVVDRPEVVAFLGSSGQAKFRQLLNAIFAFIDSDAIVEYDVTPLQFVYKVGLLNLFKDCDPPQQLVWIADFDEAKGLARTVYWTREQVSGLSVAVDGVEVPPAFAKRRRRDFMGETFCWEHIAWVPVGEAGTLVVSVDGLSATVRLWGREHRGSISPSAIRATFARKPLNEADMPAEARALRRLARTPDVVEAFRGAWLFMDRDTEADDSAEHLYRWVRRNHPDINAFFVLGGDAPDWKRLVDEGFRLLTANAPEHAVALVNARYVISSHADAYVHDRLPSQHFGDLTRYRYVFLQHGVIKDDISGWLNRYRIGRFITSTPREFAFVAGDGPFKFTGHEVVLTGLPRHDGLLKEPVTNERMIVIMPTWRLSLAGEQIGATNKRKRNPDFADTDYARRWRCILGSPRLAETARRCGYRIVFVPHKNLEPYVDAFRLPPQVEVRCFGGAPIAPLFRGLSLFVTDFTSKAFDIAYMNKPVMYYQFDRDVFLGGGHISRPGYFDYNRDGFGPVFTEEDDLIAAIEAFMEGKPPDPIYRERAEKTFPFRDGKCCERVFEAILDLEQPASSPEQTVYRLASAR